MHVTTSSTINPDAGVEAPPIPVPTKGGRRPGAGAPKGNLNAFRHGRHSRFRDLIAQETGTVSLAARAAARHRRVIDRHIATLLDLHHLATAHQAHAEAIEQGRPLPPPPLFDLTDLDLQPLLAMIARLAKHNDAEAARRRGELPADHPAAAHSRLIAERAFELLRVAPTIIQQSLQSLPSAATLAAALDRLLAPHTPPSSRPDPS